MSILHTPFLPLQKPLFVKKTMSSYYEEDAAEEPCLPAGSKFFIASLDERAVFNITEYHNLAAATIVVTKKGKTSKMSMPNMMKVFIPIFWPQDDPEMEKGFLKLMPPDKKMCSHTIIVSEDKTPDCGDVRNLTQVDFIGWCAAQSVYIHSADSFLRRGQGKVFQRIRENGTPMEGQIIDTLKFLCTRQKRSAASNDYIRSSLLDNREVTITLIRRALSEVIIGARRYYLNVLLSTICQAARFLVFANKNRDYRFTEDETLLERTVSHYERMSSDMSAVIRRSRFRD